MATFRDSFAETITEEDLQRNRRDRLAHLAQERARMEMANRLGIDYEYLGTLRDQADNQIQNQMPNELTIDPIELTIPSQPQPRYQSGFDGQMIRQGTVVPPQPNTTGLSLLGENATSLANDIVNRRRNRISNQSQASMPTSSANNPVMTGILQALSQPQSVQNVTGSPTGYSPEMIRAQSQQPRIDQEAGVDYRSGSPAGYMSAMENESMNPTRFSGLLGQPGVEQRQISGAPRDVVDGSNPIPIDPVMAPVQYIEENQNIDQYGLGEEESRLGLKPGGGVGLKSDLIDYAKDGSGDVLYNGQNTGVKADELNEAQQRLSGNYGSQDHYQKTFGNQEFLLALAIGLNSLSTFPNQQWGQFLQGQMQSIQKRKGAIDGANWLLSKGRRDLAEAVATGTLDFDKAYAEFTKKPEETFREFTAEEYKAIGHDPLTGGRIQVSNTSGRIIGGPYTKSTASVTNVNFPGEAGKERDKAFAKTYTENLEKLPDQMQQINTLKSVVDSLESGEVETGISKGLLPEWALALVDPKSLDARNQVASVVQRTLRETLGAQFTEREGENLLRRAWDLRQPTEVNIRNTRRLLETAMAFVEERTNQMQWFEDNGTLDGYKSDALNKLRSELVKMKNELVAPLPKDYDDQVGASGKGPKQFKKDGVAFTIEEVD
jgi:hypothetical protein